MPSHVQRVGLKTYAYEPGVFGEYVDITEAELTTRTGAAPLVNTPIDIEDLVVEADNHLIVRELDRMESSVWTLLTTGTLAIQLDRPDGTQQGYADSYPIQTIAAPIPWATVATATPIKNFQAVQQMGIGHSVDLGAGATAFMNSVTSNNLLNNANAADLGGRREQFGATFNSVPEINQYLLAQNLPRMQVYDNGFQPAAGPGGAGAFRKFIPDNTVVVVGRRPGNARVGEYQLTRNASNGFLPGSYRYVIDRANGMNGEKRTPANIEVHRGHNGGPAIYYPSAVVVMNV